GGAAVIAPAAIAAGLTASGASAGNSSPSLAMAGAKTATSHPDAGMRLTGAARHEVAKLGVSRVRAERAAARRAAARRAAAHRAARRAAERRAQRAAAAATPAPAPSAQGSSGSAPQPSGNPQQIASAMLGSYGWSSSEFGCLVSLWNLESGWNVCSGEIATGQVGAWLGVPVLTTARGPEESLLPGVPPCAAGRRFARRPSVHGGRSRKGRGPHLSTFNL